MSDPRETWTSRLRDLSDEVPPENAERFVNDLYAAAQADLDEQRAQADFEREE
ncbi:hypothetical protein [Streptomyces sp. NPDC088725]|uniref:hypothetical protein n=1 Tax=Streptomyces sp. NPDC088725 TaxID=3365873 RepID=UPI0037F29658